MKKSFKFIGFTILFLLLVIGGIFAYQVYGTSDKTDWEAKDQTEQEQEQESDSAVEDMFKELE